MFDIISVKAAIVISAVSLVLIATLIVYFRIAGKKYNQVDKMRRDTKIAIIALIVILVATWVLSGCFTKSETATEEAETSEAEAAAIAEAQKKFSGRFSFLENKDQEKTMTETRLEEMEKLKKSNLSEAELIKELTEIDKRTNDVTLISGNGYVPANWAELDVDEYCQKGGALIDPDRGNCHLAMAHMVATAERLGNYHFDIDGWTVGKGKDFSESENKLAEMLANDPELYSSIYNELVSLNLEATEITGTFIVVDEVQGGKAVYLGEEAAGKFIELYFKNKAGKEKLFARFYKPCGNAAEKKSTVAKKTDPTPATPDPVETYTFKVVYDANGGKNPPVSETKTSTSSATMNFKLSSDKPTRSGYVFKGWSLEKVTPSKWSSAKIITEASVEANKTVTVHAVWKEKSSGGGNSSSGDGCPASEVSKSSVAEGSPGSYTENANKDAGHTGVDTGKNGPSDPGSGAGVKTDSNGNQVGTSGTSNSSSGGSANSGTSGATSDSNGSTGTIKDPAGIDISDEDF